MKISNADMLNFRQSLDFLSTSYGEGNIPSGARKLPSELVLAVITNRERLQALFKNYEEARQVKLKEYAKMKDDQIVSTKEAVAQGDDMVEQDVAVFKSETAKKTFQAEQLALLAVEVEFVVHSVSEGVIKKIVEIEEWVLTSVRWIIKGYKHEIVKIEEPKPAKTAKKNKAVEEVAE